METSEYRLSRGTCFVAHRLEMPAISGLLWTSWCVFGTAGFRFSLFERTRPAASMRPPCLIYLSKNNDCDSCTRLISTNPRFMEAGEYGLTRGTCSVARRVEVVAVDELLWIRGVFWVRRDLVYLLLFDLTRPAASMRPPCLIYRYSSIYGKERTLHMVVWRSERVSTGEPTSVSPSLRWGY